MAVLSSGDELVEPSTASLGLGQIRDANRSMLLAAIQAANAQPLDLGIAEDTQEDVEKRFQVVPQSMGGGLPMLSPTRGPESLMSIARPAFATAPVVNRSSKTAEAWPSDRPKGICYSRVIHVRARVGRMRAEVVRTGVGLVKKSMSLPIVNGTLMETALDTMSSPMAIPRGLRSGLASAMIFRKEDALLVVSWASAGTNLLHSDFFGEEVGLFDDRSDEDGAELDVVGGEEHRADEENCRRARASRLQGRPAATCQETRR